jgi:hypothetical protein
MTAATLDDYRWLTSDTAATWLSLAAELSDDPLTCARRLRRELSGVRGPLVQEQAQLRRRAARKFAIADRMFFTSRGLEQATDEKIAAYKQQRFASGWTVADLCCGIGGDTLAIADRGPVMGVERDEIVATLAAANLQARSSLGSATATIHCADAIQFPVADCSAWHIDPDRRPQGSRTTRVALHEPNDAAIDSLRARNPSGAIKLAPAAEVPPLWAAEAELEWIGHDRQCQQLVAWFGALSGSTGPRRATVLVDRKSNGLQAHSFSGTKSARANVASSIGRFVYEPHASVLAADLWRDLASQRGLAAVGPSIPYLTADGELDDSLLARFEVVEVYPFDKKRLKAALRTRRAGRLEVKKRGVEVEPETLRKQLTVDGDEAFTLIVTRHVHKTIAILARRAEK